MPQVAREAKGGWVVGASPVPPCPSPAKSFACGARLFIGLQESYRRRCFTIAADHANEQTPRCRHTHTGRLTGHRRTRPWCRPARRHRPVPPAQLRLRLRLGLEPRGRSGAAAAPAPVSGTNVLLSGAASACSRVARAAGGWVVLLFPYIRWVGGV